MMKTILFYSASVIIAICWLVTTNQTHNPIFLRGPDFLKFYLLLLLVFYTSVLILKFLKQLRSKATVFFMVAIFSLGITKLIRGLYLEKPIGFLVMILLIELVVIVCFIRVKSSPIGT